MRDTSAEGPGNPLDDGLRDLLDDHHHQEAVTARRQAHWLRRQAEESGSLHGVLVDLCEQGVQVTVRTCSGQARSGVVEAVGADFVRLRSPDGVVALVVTGAITQARPEPGIASTAGDRTPPETAATLLDVLADLAADRAPVTLTTSDGGRVRGYLRAVGTDVVSVATGAEATVYLALGAVSDVVLS